MKYKLLPLATLAGHYRDGPLLDATQQATMCCAVMMDAIEELSPAQRWSFLATGLMLPFPMHFFQSLRMCMGLKRLLPELDGLFGVMRPGYTSVPFDVGLHQLQLVKETARIGAPIGVRFAALMHKIGQSGLSHDTLPSHDERARRAHLLLAEMTQRIAVPLDALELARLVIDECDRVHSASDMQAGSIALLLKRLNCETQPERLDQLLTICACDYAAYDGHSAYAYVKAPRLRRALKAYLETNVDALGPEAALQVRAQAIACTLQGRVVPSNANH
jgi:tRNA nucleotidyltransferase (CCA-adding enzyme)